VASNDSRARIEELKVVAAVARVQTMADGGLRFVFDTDERQVVTAAWLMAVKADESAVELTLRRYGP
jgi:hypothetical protein